VGKTIIYLGNKCFSVLRDQHIFLSLVFKIQRFVIVCQLYLAVKFRKLLSIVSEIVPVNVNIIVGRTLELNCSILSGYIKYPEFNSSNLFFKFVQSASRQFMIDSQYYRTNGPEMLQLLYPNVSEDDTGTYSCYVNETMQYEFLASTTVTVGSKFSIVCSVNSTFDSNSKTSCMVQPFG